MISTSDHRTTRRHVIHASIGMREDPNPMGIPTATRTTRTSEITATEVTTRIMVTASSIEMTSATIAMARTTTTADGITSPTNVAPSTIWKKRPLKVRTVIDTNSSAWKQCTTVSGMLMNVEKPEMHSRALTS